MDELRQKGLAKMNEVYAWEMPNIEGNAYFDLTVDHLFGTIWTRPALSMREKRIITLAVVTALGQQDLAEVQLNAALQNEELTEQELREMAIFVTHYVGFPLGSGLNGTIERVIAKRKTRVAAGTADDKRANVNEVVKQHTGGKTVEDYTTL
jgi:4-carboxymuconolactone decarboxylase